MVSSVVVVLSGFWFLVDYFVVFLVFPVLSFVVGFFLPICSIQIREIGILTSRQTYGQLHA